MKKDAHKSCREVEGCGVNLNDAYKDKRASVFSLRAFPGQCN